MIFRDTFFFSWMTQAQISKAQISKAQISKAQISKAQIIPTEAVSASKAYKTAVRALAAGLSAAQLALGIGVPARASVRPSPKTSLPKQSLPEPSSLEQTLSKLLAQSPGEEPALSIPVLPFEPASATDSEKILAARQLADLLPAETPMAIFFSTDRADWEALQEFELFAKLAGFADPFLTGLSESGSELDAPFSSGEAERWQGKQFVIAALPDTSPRSIAVTDPEQQIVLVMPVSNADALEPYKASLEAERTEAPEKSTYLGAELWVWPEVEQSYGDYGDWDDNEYDLPDVPHEDWPSVKRALLEGKSPSSVTANKPTTALDSPLSKALNSDRPTALPEDFGQGDDYGTYVVEEGKAIAFIDGYVLQATDSETLKKLLKYREFDYATLNDNPLFSRSEYGQETSAIVRIYSDLSEISKYNLDGSEFTPPATSPFPGMPDIPGLPSTFPGLPTAPPPIMRQETQAQIVSALKGITLEGIIYPQTEGIRFQGRVYGNNLLRSQPTPELDYADSVLEFVPAATYSLSSGRDIAGIWRSIARNISLNPTTREYLQQARDFVQMATGLDLDDELLGWMDREFVLFFFPSNKGALNSFSPGLGVEIGIAIQTSDRPTAQNTLDTIDSLLSFFAQSDTVNGTPVVSWAGPTLSDNPDAPLFTSYVSHGWISEDTLIITSGTGAMSQLLNPVAFAPVSEHPTFLTATDTLAKPNNGYGYVNAGSSFSLIYGLVSEWLEIAPDDPFFQTVKSYLGTIRGAGSTTSSTAEYWQLDSLLNLAPTEENITEASDVSIDE